VDTSIDTAETWTKPDTAGEALAEALAGLDVLRLTRLSEAERQTQLEARWAMFKFFDDAWYDSGRMDPALGGLWAQVVFLRDLFEAMHHRAFEWLRDTAPTREAKSPRELMADWAETWTPPWKQPEFAEPDAWDQWLVAKVQEAFAGTAGVDAAAPHD
jgi:hypothetical protein